MKSLDDVEQVLLAYAPSRLSGADYQLERISALLQRVGNPQNNLRVVHVAGTSGKTSTAYFSRALLEATGVKVGLTVSPHIKTICERVQIQGGPIADKVFVKYFNEFYPLVEDVTPHPTYFELLTAFAYWVFEKEHVDYAVVEVGLGGRYDATNMVSREDKVCLINSIGYDHTEMLGETLAEIASEKAGIIQSNNTVFTVDQDDEAWTVIENEARAKHARLIVSKVQDGLSVSMPHFQRQNFHLAFAAVSYIAERDGLNLPEDLADAIEALDIPGRFEIYALGDKKVILDGAHNPQKLEALIGSLPPHESAETLVVAAISEAPEKKVIECVRLLSSIADKTFYTSFVIQRDITRRSVGPEELSKYIRDEDSYVEDAIEAVSSALQEPRRLIVITGSLYLVSIVRPYVRRLAGLSE